MAGYSGYSMSNNAEDAYERGLKPLSKWTKSEIISTIQDMVDCGELELQFDISMLSKVRLPVLKEKVLTYIEWHHTSKFFNRTSFYNIDISYLENLSETSVIELSKIKAEKKEPQPEPTPERWHCSYLIWHPYARRRKAERVEKDGVIIGDWFYPDYTDIKKSIFSKGFEKIYPIRDERE